MTQEVDSSHGISQGVGFPISSRWSSLGLTVDTMPTRHVPRAIIISEWRQMMKRM